MKGLCSMMVYVPSSRSSSSHSTVKAPPMALSEKL